MKIGFVIPSRLKSTRLPRKNLLYLGSQSALGWAIDRAKMSTSIDEVVVATTPLKTDADVTKVCCEKKVRYYQGDPVDVLKRLRDTAEYFDFDYVVNITPDNTLFSIYLIDLMVTNIKQSGADYYRFKDIMLGSGIYALKREALQTVCDFKETLDTEIWGPLFHEKYFDVVELDTPEFLKADYRLTMDTPEDYLMLNRIYEDLNISKENIVELERVINYLNKNPEVAGINKDIVQSSVPKEIIFNIRNHFEKHENEFYEIRNKYYER